MIPLTAYGNSENNDDGDKSEEQGSSDTLVNPV